MKQLQEEHYTAGIPAFRIMCGDWQVPAITSVSHQKYRSKQLMIIARRIIAWIVDTTIPNGGVTTIVLTGASMGARNAASRQPTIIASATSGRAPGILQQIPTSAPRSRRSSAQVTRSAIKASAPASNTSPAMGA